MQNLRCVSVEKFVVVSTLSYGAKTQRVQSAKKEEELFQFKLLRSTAEVMQMNKIKNENVQVLRW